MRAVEDDELGISRRVAERALENFRREARAAHAEHHDMLEAVGLDLVGERADVAHLIAHLLRQSEPAEAVGWLGNFFRRPERRVFLPKTRGEVLRLPRFDAPVDAALVFAEAEFLAVERGARPLARSRGERGALFLQRREKIVERLDERGDAELGEAIERAVRLVEIFLDA